jgi:hypothetical protein
MVLVVKILVKEFQDRVIMAAQVFKLGTAAEAAVLDKQDKTQLALVEERVEMVLQAL